MSTTPEEERVAWGPRPDLSRYRGPEIPHLEEQLASSFDGPKSGQARMRSRQREYAQVLRGRFAKISAEIRKGVAERDIFQLKGSDSESVQVGAFEQLASSNFEPDDLNPSDYRYRDAPEQYDLFMQWLERQHNRGVLEVIQRDGNTYVRNATRDGVRWAQRQLRAQGVATDVSLTQAFNQAIDARQLNLLYQRNYDLLTDITESVSKEIGRVLTDGFQQGLNPRDIADEMTSQISSVGKTRATQLARYEVMNAQNVGALTRYEDAGVTQVDVLTSGPCEDCQRIADQAPMPIEEARGQLPAHPSCVCTFAPQVTSIET